MGKHARSSRLLRLGIPLLAAGSVFAVVGVSSVLLGRGAPAPAARAADKTPAAVSSSSASTLYGCAESEGGLSTSVLPTTAPACPPRVYGVTRQVQPTRRSHKATHKVVPKATSPSIASSSPHYFGLAPLGTSLPRSDAYCASHVQRMAENVPANEGANHDIPPAGTNFDWGQATTGNSAMKANFARVDGNFSGTTGEILEWAACKWGWDQDYAMAEAIDESVWKQSEVSGNSYGILQVNVSHDGDSPSANSNWGGYPWVQESTAVDADAQMAYLRSCYDGDVTYLGNGYHAGDAWGCIGSWFSGEWYDSGATGYISDVKGFLGNQTWRGI
jgi:hypothetical protein